MPAAALAAVVSSIFSPCPETGCAAPMCVPGAIAATGSAPFIGVRTSTVREQSLTFKEFGVAVENAAGKGRTLLIGSFPAAGYFKRPTAEARTFFAGPHSPAWMVTCKPACLASLNKA